MARTRYPVPAGAHRIVEEVKRSRFITEIGCTPSVEAAQAFVQRLRDEFPDATHHCWAYVVGPPGSTAQVGMSDDGEPHGTAGRPMLNALLHAPVGDVTAVVVRYYGGTNLGTGGLVRAYGGGVIRALETLPTVERVEYATLAITVDYGRVSALEQLLPAHGAVVAERRFEADATFVVRVPVDDAERLAGAILDLTRGQAKLETRG